MKGDVVLERGRMDVVAGRMIDERSVTRGETQIERDAYEYRLAGNGGMIALAMWGDLYNFQGEERNQTKAVYLRMTENGLDFVVASAMMGVNFPPVPLGDGEMTPDEAALALKAAGFAIQIRGSVLGDAVSIQ